jgi:hypothetical protein
MDAAPGVVIVDGRGRFMTPTGCSTNNSRYYSREGLVDNNQRMEIVEIR